jgi:hypothetical protein
MMKGGENMCCGTGSYHGGHHGGHRRGHYSVSSCGCGGPAHLGACVPTKEEKVSWLELYLEGLQEATATVEARIAALKEEE